MKKIKKIVKDFLAAHLPLGASAYVGFSGGADSTALLKLLCQCQVSVIAVHFHHGLRGAEADADAQWCREFCANRGIPYFERHLDLPAHQMAGESCEACGRRLRLANWKELCAQGQPVFLAHHGDDVLEELFLRLGRGGNASSLVPLRAKRVIDGVCFLRPLLSVRRCDIEEYLKQEGIHDWRVDSTNLENEFRRNRVRNQLLPLYREIFAGDGGVVQAIQSLHQDGECLEDLAKEAYSRLSKLEDWRSLAGAIFYRCVRQLVEAHYPGAQVTGEGIQRLRQAVQRYDGRQLTVQMNGMELYVTSDGVAVQPKPWEDINWNWQENRSMTVGEWLFSVKDGREGAAGEYAERFEASSMPDVIQIRHWRPGDTMTPFGSQRTKKLQDLFTDVKVPRYQRPYLPVLEADGEIIWVPGVRRAEWGRCQNGPIICLSARNLTCRIRHRSLGKCPGDVAADGHAVEVSRKQQNEFRRYVVKQLMSFQESIDLSRFGCDYGWDETQMKKVFEMLLWDLPEIFFVSRCNHHYQWSHKPNGLIASFVVTDLCHCIRKEEYNEARNALESEVNKALQTVQNVGDDIKKALLLHDYIIKTCRYDSQDRRNGPPSPLGRTVYSVLVRHSAVCEGYTMTYSYLLKKAGIQSAKITSDSMRHCWNYVKLNGNWYHVDVTWDDPVFHEGELRQGEICHKNFLMSDRMAEKTHHHDWSTNGLPPACISSFENINWEQYL